MALFATYWDDSWHTDRGRDATLAPPHVALYVGVAVMAGAVVVWWWHAGSRVGRRVALGSDPLLARAASGVMAMIVSAPLDDLWHRLYGRDAILWSPPHLLAVAATTLVAAALVAAVARIETASGPWLRPAAGALLLGALVVPVMEYESDVPQLAVGLYLPVLCAGVLVATGVIRRVDPSPWAVTRAAIAYSGLRAGIVVVLAAIGSSTPIISPVLVLAVVIDLMIQWHRSPWWLILAVPVVAHGVYVLWLPTVPNGVAIATSAVPASLVGSIAASGLAVVLAWDWIDGRRWISVASVGLVGAALAVGGWPGRPAAAHDPGQGEVVAGASVSGIVEGQRVRLEIQLEDCADLTPRRTVARRAGETEIGALRATDAPCRFEGRVETPADGRWFVYAELEDGGGRTLETWIPVSSGGASRHDHRRDLYRVRAPSTGSGQSVAGAALLLSAAALFTAAARVPVSRTPGRARPPEPVPPDHDPPDPGDT